MSAFRGAHATRGKLRKFFAEIGRRVRPGDHLLSESLDRLGRDEPKHQLKRLLEVQAGGIWVTCLLPSVKTYDPDDDMARIEMQIVMMRAHEESLAKSKRIKAAWASEIEANRKGEKPIRNLPGWVRHTGDGYELIGEKAVIVRRIVDEYLAGGGTHAIARRLNEEGVPPLAHGKRWGNGSVREVLTNPSLFGDVEPGRGGAIEGVLPPIIDRPTFDRIAGVRAKRKRTPRRTANSDGPVNLFGPLLIDVHCGNRSQVKTYIDKRGGTRRNYRPDPTRHPGCGSTDVPVEEVEWSLLQVMDDLTVRDLTPPSLAGASDRYAAARRELEAAEGRLARAAAKFRSGGGDRFLDLFEQLQDDVDAARAAAHEAAVAANAAGPDQVRGELRSVLSQLDEADEEERNRLRLRLIEVIPDAVTRIDWLPGRSGAWRCCLAELRLRSGSVRRAAWYASPRGDLRGGAHLATDEPMLQDLRPWWESLLSARPTGRGVKTSQRKTPSQVARALEFLCYQAALHRPAERMTPAEAGGQYDARKGFPVPKPLIA